MTIVHIANHFLPSPGGVEWSVLRTAEAQARRGDRVHVITETPAGDFDDEACTFEILRFSVTVHRPFTRLLYWRAMWRHRTLLRSADVLHFHDYTPLVHWFLPLRALIRGPRYAITFHGFEGWPLLRRHRLLRSLAARLCHVRFAVGAYIQPLYGHPVDAVYLGAPVRNYSRIAPARQLRFMFAGRLESDTGIDRFVSMLSAIATERRESVVMEIAGEGRLRDVLESARSPFFSLVLHGQLRDLHPLYLRSRFVVATGYLGIFEALQCGLPVLAPAFSEIKRRYLDALPDAPSMLTIMRDDRELRTALEAALSADAWSDFAEKAERGSAFVSEYTWDDIAVLLASWYRHTDRRSGERADDTSGISSRY